jgi:acyl-coenzyme A thioesterase PaaI-like protein
MEVLHIPHTKECFICGCENPVGIKHTFYVKGDSVRCDLFLPKGYDGVYNIIHGGLSTAVVDETMAWCAYIFSDAKNMFMTRELKVKFKYPLMVNTNYFVETSFIGKNRLYVLTKGWIKDEDGKIYLEAEGKFVESTEKNMYETGRFLIFDSDKTYHPRTVPLKKYALVDEIF